MSGQLGPPCRGWHVLVVEDDPMNREILQNRLAVHGCTCAVATDGEAALELAARERFDVVLLDIRLPGIDGFEVLRGLQGMQFAPPVVMMTAHGMPDLAERARLAGAAAYFLKPVGRRQLIETIEQAVLQAHPERGEETP